MAKDIFPLGFHAGNTGHYPADLIHAINQKGLRAFVKVIDDDGQRECFAKQAAWCDDMTVLVDGADEQP